MGYLDWDDSPQDRPDRPQWAVGRASDSRRHAADDDGTDASYEAPTYGAPSYEVPRRATYDVPTAEYNTRPPHRPPSRDSGVPGRPAYDPPPVSSGYEPPRLRNGRPGGSVPQQRGDATTYRASGYEPATYDHGVLGYDDRATGNGRARHADPREYAGRPVYPDRPRYADPPDYTDAPGYTEPPPYLSPPGRPRHGDQTTVLGPVSAPGYAVPPGPVSGPGYPTAARSGPRPPVQGRWPEPVEPEDPPEDEAREHGFVGAAVATVLWYLLPVAGYLGWALTLTNRPNPDCVDASGAPCLAPRGQAVHNLVHDLPRLGVAIALSLLVALLIRMVTPVWRGLSVGFAAAVVGAGVATVLFSVLTGAVS